MTATNTTSNIVNLTPIGIPSALGLLARSFRNERASLTRRFVVNILGDPGQGKTALLDEHVEFIKTQLPGKSIAKIVYKLNQSDPSDLKGVPIYAKRGELDVCTWAVPDAFPILGEPQSGMADFTVFFLDEFNQAIPTMQNLGANLIDGIVGDKQIDFNRCQFVMAGNNANCGAAVYDMPSNLKTRVLSYNLNNTFDDWKVWAKANDIHVYILAYLENFGIHFTSPSSSVAGSSYPNPRTWEALSNDLKNQDFFLVDKDDNAQKDTSVQNHEAFLKETLLVCQGLLGPSIGQTFYQFIQSASSSLNIKEIVQKGTHTAFDFSDPEHKQFFYVVALQLANILTGYCKEIQSQFGNNIQGIYDQIEVPGETLHSREINNIFSWLSSVNVHTVLKYLMLKNMDASVKETFNTLVYYKDNTKFEKARTFVNEYIKNVSSY